VRGAAKQARPQLSHRGIGYIYWDSDPGTAGHCSHPAVMCKQATMQQ